MAAFALAAVSIAEVLLHNPKVTSEPASIAAAPSDAWEALAGGSDRPDYRYSVIPGGAYSGRELLDAIATDKVVAAHYVGLDEDRVRTEIVPRDRMVHVSYRKGGQIFWTKNKVLLRQGETILTDGKTEIRARCGNCISEQPLGPTSDEEPDEVEFDRLVTDPPAPLEVVTVTPMSPGALASGAPRPLAGGSLGSVGGGIPTPLASGAFAAFGGADDPLASETSEPAGGPPAPDPGTNSSPGTTPQPPGTTPQPPLPGGDDPMPPLEDITLIPPGPEDPGQPPGLPPGPEGPRNPPEFPPPGEPVNPVPVPEPGTLLLVGGGGIAALVRKLRARKR